MSTYSVCHRSARLIHHPITARSVTRVLNTHTCKSSAPSSASVLKHTPLTSTLSNLVHSKWTLSMLSIRYIEKPTFCTYLLCLLQSYLQLLTPTSLPVIISLWIIATLIVRGVCLLQSPSHDLLRTKKQGYIL